MKRTFNNELKPIKSKRPLFIVLAVCFLLVILGGVSVYISYSPEHVMNSAVQDPKLVEGGTVLYKHTDPSPFDLTAIMLKRMPDEKLRTILKSPQIFTGCTDASATCTNPIWISAQNFEDSYGMLGTGDSKAQTTIATMFAQDSTMCTGHGAVSDQGLDVICVDLDQSLFLYEHIEI